MSYFGVYEEMWGEKMSYGIVRIQKYNNSQVRGIENHLERRNTTTNPDIDKSKSKMNYDLTAMKDRTLKSMIKEKLQNVEIKKKRKDVVTMVEMLFTASPEFFENMTDDEIRSYFQNCYEFAAKKYGAENIIAADVHLDEKTPHMHLELVPISKGRLCAKDLFNHKLEELQEQAHQQVFSHYGLERGDSHRKAKHISTLNYKILTLEKKEIELQQQIAELENARDNSQLYKLQRDLKSTQQMLSKMFQVLENNPKLMAEYKQAIVEMEKRENAEEKELQ